jgi:hypothetical protein
LLLVSDDYDDDGGGGGGKGYTYIHTHTHTQGMDKIMETCVKDTHFYINIELGHHLPVIQLVSILK